MSSHVPTSERLAPDWATPGFMAMVFILGIACGMLLHSKRAVLFPPPPPDVVAPAPFVEPDPDTTCPRCRGDLGYVPDTHQ